MSADWLAERTGSDQAPALSRLVDDATLAPHPRLPRAWIVPRLLEILDDPYPAEPSGTKPASAAVTAPTTRPGAV